MRNVTSMNECFRERVAGLPLSRRIGIVRAILSFTAILGFFLQCNVAGSAPRDVEYAVYRCIDQHRNPTVRLGPGTIVRVYHCDGRIAGLVKLILNLDTEDVLRRRFQNYVQSVLKCDDYRNYCTVTVTQSR
jgi:hypothetical protein